MDLQGSVRMPMSPRPWIPAVNTVKTELLATWDSQIVENVHWWLYSTPPSISDMTALGQAIRDWWVAQIKPIQATAVTLNKVKCTDMNTQVSPVVEVTSSLPQSGIGGGDTLPNNCAVVVKWLTANRGKSYRGRTYFYGLQEANVTKNTVSSVHTAQILAAYTALKNLVVTPQPVLVVASFATGNQWRTQALTTGIIDLTVEDTIDSQRRRLPGRGA